MTRGWASEDRVTRRLLILGSASSLLYIFIAWLSRRFQYGWGHSERPILAVLSLFGLAWFGYALALWTLVVAHADRPESPPGASPAGLRRFPIVVGFAILYRLILLPSSPIQEIDYYRYLWDGRVLAAGMNPFAMAPAEIDRLGPVAGENSMPAKLWRLSSESESVRTIYSRIHHREVPTIYPPFSQAVFAALARLTPASAPLWIHLSALKLTFIVFDLGVTFGLAALLALTGKPASWSVAYGWCPLALKEIANGAHLDAIAVCFSVLAAVALARVPRRLDRVAIGNSVLAAVALAIATLSKSYALILVPLATTYLLVRSFRVASLAVAVYAAILFAAYVPFVARPETPEHSPWTGLSTFLARWQKNDLLFMVVHENLRPPTSPVGDRWFVVLPPGLRSAIADRAGLPLAEWIGGNAVEPAFLLTQILMGLVLVALVARWSVRIYRDPEPPTLLRGFGLVLVWGWLLSATPHPWYLTWSLPFLIFERRRGWFLLTASAFLYYVRFFLEYQALAGGDAAVSAAFDRFDYGVVWIEYTPVFVALAIEPFINARRRTSAGAGPAPAESVREVT